MTRLSEITLEQLRTRRSAKWQTFPAEVLPAFIAEMDFLLAPAIAAAIETAVHKKVEGEEIAISPSAPKATAQVIDLMDALRASLEKTAGKRAAPRAATASAQSAPAELKTAQRKPPKKVSAEPETRRKSAKR